MNKYDERYDIRLAVPSDIPAIMCFLNDHWKAGHLLSVDRAFFEYEFLEDEKVNMMLAIDKNTLTIEALTGFLPCSHTTDKDKLDVWGSFWKVNDSHSNMTFLGVEIMKRLIQTIGCRYHLGIGINPNTSRPIHKVAFREKTAKMKHFYRLNPETDDYQIACVKDIPACHENTAATPTDYEEFFNVEQIKQRFNIEVLDTVPYKDFWYVNKRFFQHPYYQYHVYGLKNAQNEVRALVIARAVRQNDREILRIVDYIGNQKLFSGTAPMFRTLLSQYNYEYIDFYTFGFDESSIQDAGFIEHDSSDPNIIPNYFEPFVQENIDIWIRYTEDGTLFFKADGDQDRPNLPFQK